MKEKISIIGGDLRIVNLAQMMQQDGKEILVYGMEHSEEIMENKNIIKTKTLDEAIENANIIIGSIPFASDDNKMYATFSEKDIKIEDLVKRNNKNKKFIAGSINEKSYKLLSGSFGGVIDVMKREELVILTDAKLDIDLFKSYAKGYLSQTLLKKALLKCGYMQKKLVL